MLLTKHRHDVTETLDRNGISANLFEEIIQLSGEQRKADFIDPDEAIFIDNHWPDRWDVHERLGIPVFDVDAVECLLT